MATADSGSESDTELFSTVLKKVEEVAKPLKNPNAPVEKKPEKLETLANEGLIEKTQIRRSSKNCMQNTKRKGWARQVTS